MSRYLVGHWGHIFDDRTGERICRIVVDQDQDDDKDCVLVALQVKGVSGWSDATPEEWADVERDLEDNNDMLQGDDSGLSLEDDLPAWAVPMAQAWHSVAVVAVGDDGKRTYLGEHLIRADTVNDAQQAALEALWDARLDSASCRAEFRTEKPYGSTSPATRDPGHEPLEGWLARVRQALVDLGDTPLLLRPWPKEMDITQHQNAMVTVVEPILSPSDEFAEEALPFLRVRDEKGVILVAEPDELFSADPRWMECFSAICAGFAIPRAIGDFVGPHDLAREGTDEQLGTFERDAVNYRAASLGQHWNTPPEFVIARKAAAIAAGSGVEAEELGNAPDMKVYELELVGFDGGTDETDERILWVAADLSVDELAQLLQRAESMDASAIDHVAHIREIAVSRYEADYELPREVTQLAQRIKTLIGIEPVVEAAAPGPA